MVVWLDIIWLLNFLIDSFLLWATTIFLKRPTRLLRVFLGGFLGSLLILLALTPVSAVAAHPLFKVAISVFMVLIVFGYKNLSAFLTSLLTFYFITFLMGGILIGSHYFLSYQLQSEIFLYMDNLRGYGDPISWLFLLFTFPIAWYFSKRRVAGITVANIRHDVIYQVYIEINHIHLELKGLVDSGNQLYDPISKTPVMIVSVETIKNLLPAEIISIANNQYDLFKDAETLPSKWLNLMRIIPAKSLGRDHQLLCAFKPVHITICDEQGRKMDSKALIVFSSQELSSDGSFQCILHPHMVSGSMIHSVS